VYNTLKLSTEIQSQLIRELNPQSTLRELLGRVVQRAAEVLKTSAASIFLIDPSGETATQRAGTGYQEQFVDIVQVRLVPPQAVKELPANPVEKLGLTAWILSKGQPFLAGSQEELRNHPHYSGRHDPEMLPGEKLVLKTFLGVPLRGLRGEVIGLIKAERRSNGEGGVKDFNVNDQIVLETVGRVASKCVIYQKMAVSGELDAALTAWARDVIGEAVATEGDLDSFLDIVVSVMASVMRADSCAIYLADPKRQTLTQRAGIGSQAPRHVIRSYILPTREEVENSTEKVGLTAYIAAMGETVYAPDFEALHEHPHHKGGYDKWNFPQTTGTICGAFLGAPLQVGGTIIGVIKVENTSLIGVPDERNFADEARQRFHTLIQDVALAITRIIEQGPTRYQVIRDAQPTIVEILRGGLDVPTLVNKVVTAISDLFQARACALFLRDGNYLIQPLWAAYGWAKLGPEVRIYELKPITEEIPKSRKDRVGLTVWIAVKEKSFSARSNLELTRHPHHLGHYDDFNFEGDQKCESFMGAPLMVGDKLVGVLKVETKMRKTAQLEETTYFNELDELVFDLIAQTAAIAIENARLLEAERLADQINRQQLHLLSILHAFGRDRWYSISILSQTAERLRARRAAIAQIIDQYAALFQPDFDPQRLKNLPELIDRHSDFLEDGLPASILYRSMSEALEVQNTDEISECSADRNLVTTPRLMEPQFFLSQAATFLVKLQSQIAQTMRPHDGEPQIGQVIYKLVELRKETGVLSAPERQIFQRIIDRWLEVIRSQPGRFIRVENPYVTGTPVSPRVGSPFFGRQDIFQWVADNLRGATQNNVLVLHGQRRMGKSSILVQLEKGEFGEPLRQDPDCPLCPVYINLQAVEIKGKADFLALIAKRVHDGLIDHPRIGRSPELPAQSNFSQSPYQTFNDYMKEIGDCLKPGLVVLMFDEFEVLDRQVQKGVLDVETFGQLRDQMQFNPHVAFILAGTHVLDEMSKDYIGLLSTFALHKEVSYLEPEDASSLVKEPLLGKVFYEEAAVEELVRVTHGHPLLIQALSHELVFQMNMKRRVNFISLADTQKTIESQARQDHLGQFVWNELDDCERALLVELSNRTEEGLACVSESRLRALSTLPQDHMAANLQHLVGRRLFERVKSPSGEVGYKMVVPFLSRWVYYRSH